MVNHWIAGLFHNFTLQKTNIMSLIEQLNWRYATKRMTGEKITADQLQNILEAIRLSASSLGLQPYTVFVVEDATLREKIAPASFNQPQIKEASHLLVFAAWKTVTQYQIESYINQIADERGISVDSLKAFKSSIEGAVNGKTPEHVAIWLARQAYIALGTGLIAAADQQVDATPMEGFNPEALDEVLGLKQRGVTAVAILALGHRDAEADYLAKAKKIRRSSEQLFVTLPEA